MFFFLIPAIMAATTTGLSIASEVTDGAIWYPEINQYKQELVQEEKTNSILNSQMSNLMRMDEDLRRSYEALDYQLGDLANKITEIETQAAKLIYDETIHGLEPEYLSRLNDDIKDDIVRGIAMVGSYNVIKTPAVVFNGVIVQPAISTAKAIKGTRIVTSLGKFSKTQGGVKSVKATKVASVGGQALKGISAGGKVISKAFGPLSAFIDIGLLGLDIHYAAQKRDQYAKAVKDARNINFELNRDIRLGNETIRSNQEAYRELAAETKDLLFYVQNIIRPIKGIDQRYKDMTFSTDQLVQVATEFIAMIEANSSVIRDHRVTFIETSLFDIKDSFVIGLDMETVMKMFPEFSREFLEFVRQKPIAGYDYSLKLQCQHQIDPQLSSSLEVEYWDGQFLMGKRRIFSVCTDSATAESSFYSHIERMTKLVLKTPSREPIDLTGASLRVQGRMKLHPSLDIASNSSFCLGSQCSPCAVYDLTSNQLRACDADEKGQQNAEVIFDFYESLQCVSKYVELNKCDWAHWSAMWDECQTARHKGLSDDFLIAKVKAGECQKENWDRLSTQIVYHQTPPVGSQDTMRCIESYKRRNQCDAAHWGEIASTCHVTENSVFPMAGDVLLNEGFHRKVIKANGDFIVNDQKLGTGRWVTPIRFVVFVKDWGNLWWAGELNASGMVTDVDGTEHNARVKSLTHQEYWTRFSIYDRKADVIFSDGNRKEIRLNGDFIVNGSKLGQGHWLSPTRFVVYVPSWGNRWWIGDVGPDGVKSTTVLSTHEIAHAVPSWLEQYATAFNSDFTCNQLGI